MTTNHIYERIIRDMPEGLDKQIISILSEGGFFDDKKASRKELIFKVFGFIDNPENLSNSTLDRQIRKAIEHLQEAGYPIISNSGAGGYSLASSRTTQAAYIAELESRRDRLDKKILALQKAERLFWAEPQSPYIQQSMNL
jgi:hypothetical protein